MWLITHGRERSYDNNCIKAEGRNGGIFLKINSDKEVKDAIVKIL